MRYKLSFSVNFLDLDVCLYFLSDQEAFLSSCLRILDDGFLLFDFVFDVVIIIIVVTINDDLAILIIN